MACHIFYNGMNVFQNTLLRHIQLFHKPNWVNKCKKKNNDKKQLGNTLVNYIS